MKKEILSLVHDQDPKLDLVLENPEVISYTTINYQLPEYEGRELKPGHKIVFSVPAQFRGRIVRDIVLRHRKGEQYRKDIGPDKHDPYGAYSLVELHSTETGEWVGWRDPKGYESAKFAEPRSAGDPENEVLHDWVATVGQVRPDLVQVTNVGQNPDFSVSQIHGLEVTFFPELEGVTYEERIYCFGTSFIDLEKNKLLPVYGGGSETEGVYGNAIVINKSREPLFEVQSDPGLGAEISDGRLKIRLQEGQLVQVEVAVGDTEHLSEVSSKTNRKTRLGYAKLWVGIKKSGKQEIDWFIKNANVPPQGVIAGSPLTEQSQVQDGDELVIESRADTAYLMGWRLAYKKD